MKRTIFYLALTVLLTVCGCGGGVDPTELQSAEAAFGEGLQAVQKGDYSTARDRFTVAIEGGPLHVDSYVEAHIQRAICQGKLREFAAGHADLDKVVAGAADLSPIHIVRAFLFRQEGRANEAKAELLKARKLNPQIKEIQ